MDSTFIVAGTTLLTALGGGAAFLINRSDRRKDNAVAAAVALWEQRVDDLKAQLEEQKAQADREIAQLTNYTRALTGAAGKWREQLLANGIQPEPVEWPVMQDE